MTAAEFNIHVGRAEALWKTKQITYSYCTAHALGLADLSDRA